MTRKSTMKKYLTTKDDKSSDKNFWQSWNSKTLIIKRPCDTFSFRSLNGCKMTDKNQQKLQRERRQGKELTDKNQNVIIWFQQNLVIRNCHILLPNQHLEKLLQLLLKLKQSNGNKSNIFLILQEQIEPKSSIEQIRSWKARKTIGKS